VRIVDARVLVATCATLPSRLDPQSRHRIDDIGLGRIGIRRPLRVAAVGGFPRRRSNGCSRS
jgi:hypothetical protein